MKVFHFRDLDGDTRRAFITIGNFDGVHLGHQALIRQLTGEAAAAGARSVLLTFEPHTASVLGDHRVPILTNLPHRIRLFEQLGLDQVVVIDFTRDVARLEPNAFLSKYVFDQFSVEKMLIGYDFAFGRDRSGTSDVLQELSRERGFGFEVFGAVSMDGITVSSSNIRRALQSGDFARAGSLLGRPYSVLETVREGRRQGRTIGFPTVNLVPEEPLPLAFGVYVARAKRHGRTYGGVANYGVRPTVGAERPLLETFLFDFTDDIYGEELEVTLLHKLRDERKFESFDALKAQIAEDSNTARAYLADHA